MLDGGADPLYVARRLIRMATEDIGLADPRALRMALDAAETYERLGSPEGELALAQCVLYLAVAPKSNAAYVGVRRRQGVHCATTARARCRCACATRRRKLMKDLGYGKGYRYAHDEADAYAAGETYLPDDMTPQRFYDAHRPRARSEDPREARLPAHARSRIGGVSDRTPPMRRGGHAVSLRSIVRARSPR